MNKQQKKFHDGLFSKWVQYLKQGSDQNQDPRGSTGYLMFVAGAQALVMYATALPSH